MLTSPAHWPLSLSVTTSSLIPEAHVQKPVDEYVVKYDPSCMISCPLNYPHITWKHAICVFTASHLVWPSMMIYSGFWWFPGLTKLSWYLTYGYWNSLKSSSKRFIAFDGLQLLLRFIRKLCMFISKCWCWVSHEQVISSTSGSNGMIWLGLKQSHLNQPPTLVLLLSAVRIWLHSVRGHVHIRLRGFISRNFIGPQTSSGLCISIFREVIWTWPQYH